MKVVAALLWLVPLCSQAASGDAEYVGPESCAACHKDVARAQSKTAMALTWHGRDTKLLPLNYDAKITEGPDPSLAYEIRRLADQFIYSTATPDGARTSLPIEVIMGGKRHGLGFLTRIDRLGEIPLERPAVIQARYFWSGAHDSLVLAPGTPIEKPRSQETSFGLVLDPAFEEKCLRCHGQPNTLGSGKAGGVHCESCHGPGSKHVESVRNGNASVGIINPRKLDSEAKLAICTECHAGSGNVSDPFPDDLLIANQVTALRNSECFIQSAKALSCGSCHDAHADSIDEKASLKTCLGCHSTSAKPRAAICPVNSSSGCIACHMPSVDRGPLHLVDHWIRVHPSRDTKVSAHREKLTSQVPPQREFIRIITTRERSDAEKAKQRLSAGEAFFNVARDLSVDSSASVGGYAGEKWLAKSDPAFATTAASLQYGQTSGIIGVGDRWMILQRSPRDFKWDADQLLTQAKDLAARGDRAGALEKCRQALRIYPSFLRALRFSGMLFAETGDVRRAVYVLQGATRLYPEDAGAQFDLALVLGYLGKHVEEIQAYKRAIELGPDLVSAYMNLGQALSSTGDGQSAIAAIRQGLQINPLSAELYFALSRLLAQAGDAPGASQAMALAKKIDPALVP